MLEPAAHDSELRETQRFGFRRELAGGQMALLLNIPTTVLVLLVLAYPLGYTLYVSFTQASIKQLQTGKMPLVGFVNYLELFKDPVFLLSLKNTFFFSLVSVPLIVLGGLFVAMAMKPEGFFIARVTRYLILLPWAVPPIAGGLMWNFIYNPNYGYLNAVLRNLGLVEEFVSVVGDPKLAMWAVIVAYVWRVVPFATVMFYAALQSIPEDLYDAAEVDGANAWQRFRSITLPLLRPTITVLLLLRTAWAFMVFDEVFAITYGGPGNATWVAAYFTYSYSFKYMEMGMGAASAYILTFIIALFALFYIKFIYTEIEY